MRENKFKAWDRENNKWITDGWAPLIAPDGSLCSNEVQLYGGSVDIVWFTGLKDRTGREIFEGDILTHGPDDIIFEVYFGFNTFQPRVLCWSIKAKNGSYFLDCPKKLEIIGNLFENSELLKEKHDNAEN